MKLLAAIAAVLLVIAALPLKAYLARFGMLVQLVMVCLDATVVVTLLTYAILGEDKRL